MFLSQFIIPTEFQINYNVLDQCVLVAALISGPLRSQLRRKTTWQEVDLTDYSTQCCEKQASQIAERKIGLIFHAIFWLIRMGFKSSSMKRKEHFLWLVQIIVLTAKNVMLWSLHWGKDLWIYGQNTQIVKYIVGGNQKPL